MPERTPRRAASPPTRTATATAPRVTRVVLLRGVNVGGKNPVPMSALASEFTRGGADEVRTYIQSGNVVFRAARARADAVVTAARAWLARRVGQPIALVVRDAEAVRRVAAANPFLAGEPAADARALHVAFLSDVPAASAVASLDPARSPPDAFRVIDREVYLCLPNGMGRTRLTNDYLDARLGVVSTVRNWRTVLALVELLDAVEPRRVD
jgi:uncharacterized protein (DUF1697 family)